MNPSENLYAFLRQWEGLLLQPTRDAFGVWNIGYGCKLGANGEQYGSITKEQAEQLLEQKAGVAAKIVNDHCNDLLKTQSQFDALCSMSYNMGTENFINPDGTRTHLYKCLLVGDFADYDAQGNLIGGAAFHICDFDKTHDKDGNLIVVQGLLNRRKAEQGLFLAPDIPTAVPTEQA